MSKRLPTEFPPWLRAQAAKAGYPTPTALARELGVAPSVVTGWFNGRNQPSVEQLRRVAPLVGKRLEELMVKAGHAQWHEFAGGRVPVTDDLLRLLDADDLSAEEKLSAIRAELASGTNPGRAG